MFYLRQLKKLNLPKTMMVVFYIAITRVHPHLLHHHLVRCNYSQGEGQLQRVISYAERVIGCNLPSLHDLHAFRTLRRLRSIRTKTSHHLNSFFPSATGLKNKARDPH
ncbi:hypothetical protein OYC64_014916 [Pagothenia borchgrevinki]|uniref:Secreted protein n=1 Tax=Pagothenia borchgrevinki TaxID=8213 RepID=A0ABD2H2D3_PAGBO